MALENVIGKRNKKKKIFKHNMFACRCKLLPSSIIQVGFLCALEKGVRICVSSLFICCPSQRAFVALKH